MEIRQFDNRNGIRNPYINKLSKNPEPCIISLNDTPIPLPPNDQCNEQPDEYISSNRYIKKRNIPPPVHLPVILPLVARLPSRNATYPSAEILTITEVTKVFHLMSTPEKTTSIIARNSFRITGMVLHIDPLTQWLILGEVINNTHTPNISKNNGVELNRFSEDVYKTSMDIVSSTSSRQHEQLKPQQGSSSLHMNTKKRKILLTKNNHGVAEQGLIGARNKKIVHKLGIDSSKSGTAIDKVANTDCKVKLTDKITKLIKDNQRRKIPLLVVDFSLISLIDNFSVGDLVMIIGEVNNCPDIKKYDVTDLDKVNLLDVNNSEENIKNSDKNCLKQELTRKMMFQTSNIISLGLKERLTVSSAGDKEQENNKTYSKKGGIYINARILKNVNGTDMNLFHEALLLRRKHLKDRIHFVDGLDKQYGVGIS